MADSVEILIHSLAVGAAERALELLHVAGDGVENAAIFAKPGDAVSDLTALAEEAFKHEPGIVFLRQGVLGEVHERVLL